MSGGNNSGGNNANNNGQSNLRDRWFIDVKGSIKGPMSTQALIRELMEGRYSVSHRVSNDGRDWAALCNVEYFEQTISDILKALSNQSENVGSSQSENSVFQVGEISDIKSIDNVTDGINEQLQHAKQLEEISATIQKLNSILKEVRLKRKTVTHEKEATGADEVHPDDQDVFIAAPKKQPGWKDIFKWDVKQRRIAMGFGIFVAVTLTSYKVYEYFTDVKKEDVAKKQLEAARISKQSSDYTKAIASLQAAGRIDLLTPKDLLEIAEAHLRNKDTVNGELYLRKILDGNSDPTIKAKAHALNAIIAMRTNRMELAMSEFQLSVNGGGVLDPLMLYKSLHNLGALKLKANAFAEAEPLFLKALEIKDLPDNVDRVSTAIGLFETALALDRADRAQKPAASATESPAASTLNPDLIQNKRLQGVRALFETLAATHPKRLDALHLVQGALEIEDRQFVSFQRFALELIDSDPKPTKETNLLEVDDFQSDFVAWSSLYKHCVDVYNSDRSNSLISAFYASCISRSHGAKQALPFAQFAAQQNPQDPVFAGLYGALLFELKMTEDAKRVLSSNLERIESSSRIGWRALTSLCQAETEKGSPSLECQAARQPASKIETTDAPMVPMHPEASAVAPSPTPSSGAPASNRPVINKPVPLAAPQKK